MENKDGVYLPLKHKKVLTEKTTCLWKIIILVLITLNLALIASVLVVYFKLASFYDTEKADDISHFCVPCENLRNSPQGAEDEHMELFQKKTKNNVRMCCSNNESETVKLLDMVGLTYVLVGFRGFLDLGPLFDQFDHRHLESLGG